MAEEANRTPNPPTPAPAGSAHPWNMQFDNQLKLAEARRKHQNLIDRRNNKRRLADPIYAAAQRERKREWDLLHRDSAPNKEISEGGPLTPGRKPKRKPALLNRLG